MATAAKRIARLKRLDRAAVFVISLGGLAVVVSVLGILVFIAAEAVPLFRDARLNAAATGETPGAGGGTASGLQALGSDEYRRYFYVVSTSGNLVFQPTDTRSQPREIPMPGLAAGEAIVASSRALLGDFVAAGTSKGRVLLAQVSFTPVYDNQTISGLDIKVDDRGAATLDAKGRPIRQVHAVDDGGTHYLAAIVGDHDVVLWKRRESGEPILRTSTIDQGERLTQIRVGRHGAIVAAGDKGHLYHWVFDDEEPRLTDVADVSPRDEPVTALEFLVGGSSIVVGTASGEVTSWFRAASPDGTEALVRAHTYEPQGSAVVAFTASPRERSFAAAGADGSLILRHQTSEQTLARLSAGGVVERLVMTPKADGLVILRPGAYATFDLSNPHPEVSWRALFGKVWYEGYAGPEYVWQSTGGTDDFEPKLSLIPLVFGTIKGTVYAMLFAIPIAVLAALYTSQFVHSSIKAKVKPAVEIMAALPSVVIGFLAGLYLAAVVEKHLVAVWLMMVLLPAFGTAGVFVWRAVPAPLRQRLRPGSELLIILPMLLLAGWVSVALGPSLELAWFGGDARVWLHDMWGLTYDQRNCLVVGIAMGFAVIPIIFTISEDAFTSVPSSLTAASLALGASRWQTALRVVLPTASPGVFSAVMVGFGRAVGETMIVLMATGNTPLMEWSIFNGIRTLSANIAVEIPEAPYGGTLYRTLFLAAAMLFVMTFLINTVAELIRQRLRERYKAV